MLKSFCQIESFCQNSPSAKIVPQWKQTKEDKDAMQKLQVVDRTQQITQPFESFPLPLYTAEDVRRLDQAIMDAEQVSDYELMQRAAFSAFIVQRQRWPRLRHLLVVCGAGNNGGDGYELASIAHEHGIEVVVVAVSDPARLKGAAAQAYQQMAQKPITIFYDNSQVITALNQAVEQMPQIDLVIDAILGTGLKGAVRGELEMVISKLNQLSVPILAMDIPSGLSANTGSCLGEAISAAVTVTFVGVKRGLLTHQGPDHYGELYFSSLREELPQKPLLEKTLQQTESLQDLTEPPYQGIHFKKLTSIDIALPPRTRDAHKGQQGHVQVIGGSHGYGGAIILAAEAAARTGSGLVSVVTRTAHVSALLSRCPEIMTLGWELDHSPFDIKGDVLVVGPGLSKDAWGRHVLTTVLQHGGQNGGQRVLLLDADALNLVAEDQPLRTLFHQYPGECLITPHPGEAARLLQCSTQDIQQDRFAALASLIQTFQCHVLLKGVGTLIGGVTPITGDHMELRLCLNGNPAMASGGMGDVLSGIIAGLIAQGVKAKDAMVMGACLHGELADQIVERDSVRHILAGELVKRISLTGN